MITEFTKPTCIMLIGLPGCGKSTLAAKMNLSIISSDYFVEQLAAEKGMTYTEGFDLVIKEATKMMNELLDKTIEEEYSFVWDQTNLSVKSRKGKIDQLKAAGYDVVAHVFNISPEALSARRKSRPEKVIAESIERRMAASFEQPTIEEGFSEIVSYTD